jgi:hypothetical protein
VKRFYICFSFKKQHFFKKIKKVLDNKDGNKNKVSIYTLCDSSVSSLSDEILSILKYGIISNLNPKKLWNKRGVKNN